MHVDSTLWTVELYPPGRDGGCVEKFIEGLPAEQQARIAKKIELLEEYGPFSLGSGHVELVAGTKNRVYALRIRGKFSIRLLFAFVGSTIVILHGIQKKAGRLSKQDRDRADHRAGEITDYYRERHT